MILKPRNTAGPFLKKFKKLMKPLLISIFVFFALAAGGLFWWNNNAQAPSTDTELVDFLITKGSSATVIANKLKATGLIKNPLAFRVYTQITGKANKIPAGEFLLPPNLSLFKIVEELIKGPKELWVTIPEGLRKEEIAEKFTTVLSKEASFKEEFLSLTQGKEGHLFPETYLFPKEVAAIKIVEKLESTFEKKVDSSMREEINKQELGLEKTVILASLVERETKTDEERPIVAGILLNRLNLGMPLQIDATVQYAVASLNCKNKTKCEWWPTTTIEDRKIDSKFNTYKYSGLPAFPIANPGLSSLKAVVYPEESNYLYYLHDKKGEIHYAETLEEHNANIKKYIY
jgi:UPF0755 protein